MENTDTGLSYEEIRHRAMQLSAEMCLFVGQAIQAASIKENMLIHELVSKTYILMKIAELQADVDFIKEQIKILSLTVCIAKK